MGPWAKKLLDVLGGEESDLIVEDLRIEPGLITARVEGETVTISAPTIRPSLWAAIESYAKGRGGLDRAVRGEVQSEHLMQIMEHDWDESLIPQRETVNTVGSASHVAAVASAFSNEVELLPVTLLRWRGVAEAATQLDDAWSGSNAPNLPSRARRPPQSVPQRFGASGISVGGDDLVQVLVRAYSELGGSTEG